MLDSLLYVLVLYKILEFFLLCLPPPKTAQSPNDESTSFSNGDRWEFKDEISFFKVYFDNNQNLFLEPT